LRAAKKELGIMANRNGGQHGKWLWNLPAKEDKPEIKGSKAFESIEDAETKLSINEIVERARKALEEGNNQ
jgi:hypothetical protein